MTTSPRASAPRSSEKLASKALTALAETETTMYPWLASASAGPL